MTVSICENCAQDLQPGAYQVTNFITKDTTPTQFDEKIKEFAGYILSNGGRCGWHALQMAAYKGNPELVHHIVEKGGTDLLDLGNTFGHTPLYSCCENSDELSEETMFSTAKELIDLGADVNLATNNFDLPKQKTPLWEVANKTNYISVMQLLLEHGAVVGPAGLKEEGKENIKKAKKALKEKKLKLEEEKVKLQEENETLKQKILNKDKDSCPSKKVILCITIGAVAAASIGCLVFVLRKKGYLSFNKPNNV